MAPKFKKADTFDEYTTEKIDVVQNRLLGDYNAEGIYVINKKISAELVELKKLKKESYNNEFFCTAKTHGGKVIDFEISFKKNSVAQLLVAELYVLEGVPKQGGRMMNILKTPIGKYTSEVTPNFVDQALIKFNVIEPEEDEGQERKEIDDEYMVKRGMLLTAIDKLTADSYNVIYEDYFTQRINLLKATNNAYSKKILAIFNDEFNKISDFFLLDKKTKKVINYKAMNELLDKAFEDLYGLDEYAESEKDFKQKLLPILTLFISGAERIGASARKTAMDNVSARFKGDYAEALLDIKETEASRNNPTVKESNQDMINKEIKGKLSEIGKKLGKSKSNEIEQPYAEAEQQRTSATTELDRLVSDGNVNVDKFEEYKKSNLQQKTDKVTPPSDLEENEQKQTQTAGTPPGDAYEKPKDPEIIVAGEDSTNENKGSSTGEDLQTPTGESIEDEETNLKRTNEQTKEKHAEGLTVIKEDGLFQ